MQITKDEYMDEVRKSLNMLTEEKAAKLVSLGAVQNFINDNDIFEAIHAYLGSIEVPVSNDERQEAISAISRLLDDYDNKKRGGIKATP